MSLLQRYESLKKAADLTVSEVQNFDALVQSVLTQVVREALHKYQQKINVGIQDSLGDLLDIFKQKITQAIFDTANTWKVANREPVLFPRGCRFCSTRGESTIFIIEEDPQVRTLSLYQGLMGASRPTIWEGSATEHIEYVRLALPYAIFIIHFHNNIFTNLYCGWRTHALTSLENMMARPLLPNIHEGLNVCMGRHYVPPPSNLVEQSMAVLNHFWNSTFNNDISDAWWSKFRFSNKLMSGRRWAEESERDASFILQLNLFETRSLQYQLDLLVMHEQEPDENAFRHKLAEGIDKCVGDLFAGTMRYFKKTKFERYENQIVDHSVSRDIDQNGSVVIGNDVHSIW